MINIQKLDSKEENKSLTIDAKDHAYKEQDG